jgi:hypothetical protein
MVCCSQGCTGLDHETDESMKCPACDKPLYDEKGKPLLLFKYRSLKEQLRLLFMNPDIAQHLNAPDASTDENVINSPFVRIFFFNSSPYSLNRWLYQDGKVLRQWRKEGFFANKKNLVLELSFDSINTFKVSLVSFGLPFCFNIFILCSVLRSV